MQDLEKTEKLIVNQEAVVKIGQQLSSDWASGEFIGLAYFSRKAADKIICLSKSMPSSLVKSHLSEYIEFFRCNGLSIEAFDVRGDWAELNEPKDIAKFILGTKAQTLSRLQGMIKNSLIQDQVSLTVKDWRESKEKSISKIINTFKDKILVGKSRLKVKIHSVIRMLVGMKVFLM